MYVQDTPLEYFIHYDTLSPTLRRVLIYSTGQIQWRKDGDWRAGSEPLGRPSEVDIESPTWRAITPPTRVAAILPVKSSSEEHA